MKKIYLTLFLLAISLATFSTGWVKITSDSPVPAKVQLVSSTIENSVVHFKLDGYKMNPVQTPRGTAYTVTLGKTSPIQEAGAPDLPKITAALAIPDLAGMGVRVISSTYKDYPGVEIAPSKGVIIRTTDPSTVPYTYGKEYTVNAFYPSKQADAADPYIIRDVRGQNMIIYPFQYNPVTKTLRVYTDITAEIYKTSETGFNPLTKRVLNNRENSEFANLYKRHFLNGDNITYTPLDDYGRILVICHGAFMNDMKPYIDWKNSLGYPTKIVNVTDIGVNATAIKNYITSYYNSPGGLTFVLLVGDNAQIPTNTGGGLGGPSDNAYGFIVGSDHYQDVFIGRFSAENVGQVQTQVQRTLDYEKNPGLITDDWYTSAIGIASDQGPGDDNEMDFEHIRNQQTQLLAYTYTVNPELFDGSQGGNDASGNPSPTQVGAAVNDGASVILYTGHGSSTSWGTSGFSNANVNQLVNQGKLPFVFSVACVNGEFMNSTCFAEAWLRASQSGQPTGAIGFLGATINQSWNSPMAGQDEMTDILAESYSTNIKRSFAGISINGCFFMMDEYGTDGINMSDTWTVFGDPSLTVRTDNPAAMTVTNDPTLFVGSTTLTVTCDVNDARATASLNDSLLATGLIVNNTLTLTFPGLPAPNDSVRLVVSAYNKLPYIVDIPIITPNGPYILYVENHLNDTTGNNNHTADYGEEAFLTLYMKNVGVEATSNLEVKLRSSDDYVTIIDSTETFGAIAPDQIKSAIDGYKVFIHNNVPDGHVINFTVLSAENANEWNAGFSITAQAPALHTGNVVVIDSTGNNNGRLDPGETAFLKIYVQNCGTAGSINVSGDLLAANPFVTVNTVTQNYGDLGSGISNWKTYSITVDPTAPEGQSAAFMQEISADLGITALGNFDLTIGKIPVLIIDLDGNANSASVMKDAVNALGIQADISTSSIPVGLSNYSSVFVCLGVFSDNHELTSQEGQQLATYLNAGGRLYMEGGDTWWYDSPTAVHPMFHIIGVEDGYSDLSTIAGYTGTFTEGMTFTYGGDGNYIDRLTPGTNATAILQNTNPAFNTAVAYDNGDYRTIGSSAEFGGMADGAFPSTKAKLMEEYLNFFGIQPAPLAANFFGYPTFVYPGSSVNFSDYSTGGPVSWNWSFPGGTPATSTEQNPVVLYETEGIYDVQLIISDGNNIDTLVREAYVTVDIAAGISDRDAITCSVYPNPGSGMFSMTVSSANEPSYNVEVYNMTGSKVYSRKVNSTGANTETVIDLVNQPAGIYFMTITGSRSTMVEKLVIRK